MRKYICSVKIDLIKHNKSSGQQRIAKTNQSFKWLQIRIINISLKKQRTQTVALANE